MSLLGGGVAALFGELFAPLYLPAHVYGTTETYGGNGKLRREQTDRPCRAQVDSCTERMVAAEGYTDTDRAIFILADTLEGGVDSDCEVVVDEGPYAGTRWRLATPIDRDPAGAYWRARGTRVKAAANG